MKIILFPPILPSQSQASPPHTSLFGETMNTQHMSSPTQDNVGGHSWDSGSHQWRVSVDPDVRVYIRKTPFVLWSSDLQLHHLQVLIVQLWKTYFTHQYLSLLICKMRITMLFTLLSDCEASVSHCMATLLKKTCSESEAIIFLLLSQSPRLHPHLTRVQVMYKWLLAG